MSYLEFQLRELPQDYKVEPFGGGSPIQYNLDLAAYFFSGRTRADLSTPYVRHPYEVISNLRVLLTSESKIERVLKRIGIDLKGRYGIHRQYKKTGYTEAELILSAGASHDTPEDIFNLKNTGSIDDTLKADDVFYLPELLAQMGPAGIFICAVVQQVTKYKASEETLEEMAGQVNALVDLALSESRASNYRISRARAEEYSRHAHSLFMTGLSRENYLEQFTRAVSSHPEKSVQRGSALIKLYDNNSNMKSLTNLPGKKQLQQALKVLAAGAPMQIRNALIPKRLPGAYLLCSLLYYDPQEINKVIKETYGQWQIRAINKTILKGEFDEPEQEREWQPFRRRLRIMRDYFLSLIGRGHFFNPNLDSDTFFHRIDKISNFIDSQETDDLEILIGRLSSEFNVELSIA